MKTKKITAILLASLMGISTVPANVWAADSYKETEKAAITKAIQTMCAEYAEERSVWMTVEKLFWECFPLWISPGFRMFPLPRMLR